MLYSHLGQWSARVHTPGNHRLPMLVCGIALDQVLPHCASHPGPVQPVDLDQTMPATLAGLFAYAPADTGADTGAALRGGLILLHFALGSLPPETATQLLQDLAHACDAGTSIYCCEYTPACLDSDGARAMATRAYLGQRWPGFCHRPPLGVDPSMVTTTHFTTRPHWHFFDARQLASLFTAAGFRLAATPGADKPLCDSPSATVELLAIKP